MSLTQSILRFEFPDFVSLTSALVISETSTDNSGNLWRLHLQPESRFERRDADEEPRVGVYLKNLGTKIIDVKYSIILRDACGRVKREKAFSDIFVPGEYLGEEEFIERAKVLDSRENILVDGALVIDVHLQIDSDDYFVGRSSSSIGDNILKLLDNEEGADVSFKVGDVVIPAHKLLLRANAPMLFEFCEGRGDGSPIPINGTCPKLFRDILRYVYAGKVPSKNSIAKSGKELLDAANRFGLLGLKLIIETHLVKSLLLDVESAPNWLMFADSKTCALLKEYVMSFIIARSEDILNDLDLSKQLEESPKLLMEVMKAFSKKFNGSQCFGDGKAPTVNKLRKRLGKRGLDIDGTKEMLVARLNNSNKRRKSQERGS